MGSVEQEAAGRRRIVDCVASAAERPGDPNGEHFSILVHMCPRERIKAATMQTTSRLRMAYNCAYQSDSPEAILYGLSSCK